MTKKKCRCGWKPVLLLAVSFLVSCAQTAQVGDSRRRFHEDATTDVVLCHYRWEHINLTRPDYREDGFLVTLSRSSLGPAFDRLHVKRDLAVVVFGLYYTPEQLASVTGDWATLLRGHGFKRVVCVQGNADEGIDGLPIIDDTARSDEMPRHTASR